MTNARNHAAEVAQWLRTMPGLVVGEDPAHVLNLAYDMCHVRFPGANEDSQIAAFAKCLKMLGHEVRARDKFDVKGEISGRYYELPLPEQPVHG